MEVLNTDNILSPEEVDTLFSGEIEETQDTLHEEKEITEKEKKDTTEVDKVDPESLFDTPESVGSGNEDTQGKEDTKSNEDTGSSPKTNFYSSIASALIEEGILSGLDEKEVRDIKTPEDFAEAMEKHI